MKTRTKVIALAAAAVVLGAAGVQAIAAPPAGHGPGFAMRFMHGAGPMAMMGMGHGGMAGAFADPAQFDTLKTELGITTAQESAWKAYANAVQETAASMRASHENVDMNAIHGMSVEDRQAFMKGMREQGDKAFGTVKAAAEEMLAALDDTQKAKAKEILPGLATPGHVMMGGMMGHGGMMGGMMGGMGGHGGTHGD
jgi:hypothetical protein